MPNTLSAPTVHALMRNAPTDNVIPSDVFYNKRLHIRSSSQRCHHYRCPFRSKSSDGRSLAETFPSIRWVFPTAKLRYSAQRDFEFSTSSFAEALKDEEIISQWFDVWDLRMPDDRTEFMIPALQESVRDIVQIIGEEAKMVPLERIILDHTLQWNPPVDSKELAVALSYHFPKPKDLESKMRAALHRFLKQEARNSKKSDLPVLQEDSDASEVDTIRAGQGNSDEISASLQSLPRTSVNTSMKQPPKKRPKRLEAEDGSTPNTSQNYQNQKSLSPNISGESERHPVMNAPSQPGPNGQSTENLTSRRMSGDLPRLGLAPSFESATSVSTQSSASFQILNWLPGVNGLLQKHRKRKYEKGERKMVAANRGNACEEHRKRKVKCDPNTCPRNKQRSQEIESQPSRATETKVNLAKSMPTGHHPVDQEPPMTNEGNQLVDPGIENSKKDQSGAMSQETNDSITPGAAGNLLSHFSRGEASQGEKHSNARKMVGLKASFPPPESESALHQQVHVAVTPTNSDVISNLLDTVPSLSTQTSENSNNINTPEVHTSAEELPSAAQKSLHNIPGAPGLFLCDHIYGCDGSCDNYWKLAGLSPGPFTNDLWPAGSWEDMVILEPEPESFSENLSSQLKGSSEVRHSPAASISSEAELPPRDHAADMLCTSSSLRIQGKVVSHEPPQMGAHSLLDSENPVPEIDEDYNDTSNVTTTPSIIKDFSRTWDSRADSPQDTNLNPREIAFGGYPRSYYPTICMEIESIANGSSSVSFKYIDLPPTFHHSLQHQQVADLGDEGCVDPSTPEVPPQPLLFSESTSSISPAYPKNELPEPEPAQGRSWKKRARDSVRATRDRVRNGFKKKSPAPANMKTPFQPTQQPQTRRFLSPYSGDCPGYLSMTPPLAGGRTEMITPSPPPPPPPLFTSYNASYNDPIDRLTEGMASYRPY
ncbi:hypothetical protein G7Y89_g8131 [Cudoniella acicularis]|uniref:Uncharacterized protein n=1 Tax=Cudoniella acicularis TaxID=354080 RepID=A0A8H4RH78_9HELO|nr:hypothetical protein G7Y89_g8131 [Cudoniella acicularis]